MSEKVRAPKKDVAMQFKNDLSAGHFHVPAPGLVIVGPSGRRSATNPTGS